MQLDPEFTSMLDAWLSTPRNERDVVAGAELLYRITGNRRFLNQAIVRPDSVHDHIEADLRKHLDIRESGHNPQTLHQLERSLLHDVGEVLNDDDEAIEILNDDDTAQSEASADEAEQKTDFDRAQEESASPKRGRRIDHEQLAPEVQSIVEENARRYEHMRTLYNRLVSMADAEPCDRHEDILQLDRLYKAWGEAWSVYDAAKPVEETDCDAAQPQEADCDREPSPLETAQKVAAAKRYLQKHRKKLRELEEAGAAPEELRAEEEKITAKQAELESLTTITPKNKENE